MPADSLVTDEGLAVEGGTFKWNEVPEETAKDKGKKKGKTDDDTTIKNAGSHSRSPSDETTTAVDAESLTSRSTVEDHKFELKDISVRFPDGELTLVTGPTASGKSALLVSPCSHPKPTCLPLS